jgi:hypothetical protein
MSMREDDMYDYIHKDDMYDYIHKNDMYVLM